MCVGNLIFIYYGKHNMASDALLESMKFTDFIINDTNTVLSEEDIIRKAEMDSIQQVIVDKYAKEHPDIFKNLSNDGRRNKTD